MLKQNYLLVENGGICSALGYKASAIYAGIRKKNIYDLGLITSECSAIPAAVYTKNKMRAAPIEITRKNLRYGDLLAVLVNSGNANACTGEAGYDNATNIMHELANQLKIKDNQIALASTGVIGVQLPTNNILQSIPQLNKSLSRDSQDLFAKSIMTTDTFPKQIAVKINIHGKDCYIGGTAKGSGMIHPDMATMLAFITSDISIRADALQIALKNAVNKSFNMISVDKETSTNDMVLIMANGLCQNKEIVSIHQPEWEIFYEALLQVCLFLAKEIVRDGEGATKTFEVTVNEALDEMQAITLARNISSSVLLKAALFGKDANWGRIACIIGYSNTDYDISKLSISIEGVELFASGSPVKFDETLMLEHLAKKNIHINVNLGIGTATATGYGCDLTCDYVKINASYRT